MMKRYIMMLFLITGSVGKLCAQGIEFNHGSWAEIKARAKQENKLIFLDFYTVWCAPCKKMAMEVFPLPAAGAFYNKHFMNVKVDAEKGEGIVLAKTYRPSGYPTLIFTDAEGKQLYRTTGAETAEELIKHGKIALNPQEDYERLKDLYAKDELEKNDLFRYIIILKAKDDIKGVNEAFDRYFKYINRPGKDVLELMKEYVSSSNSATFKYLQSHKNEFYRLAGKKETDAYLKGILLKELSAQFFYYGKNEPLERYLAAKAALKQKVSLTEKEELGIDKSFYSNAKDEDHYMEKASMLVKKYSYHNDEELSMILGEAYLIKKEEHLRQFKKWAEMAVSLKDNALNYFGLAMIYDRLNDKNNALKYIDLSIAASKRDDDGKVEQIDQFKQQILKKP
ncbi:thioredoxin fold domain-containing protein [Pedobacter nyackensis]|uniref:thioredoxin fold domain-containing protein n=1 Tax=Pedobacter nyackensis TaxID=475255 RepID=UPI00293176E5|nr:thioredoxin fold domain-containing protein [Pedobacter nyackensis]